MRNWIRFIVLGVLSVSLNLSADQEMGEKKSFRDGQKIFQKLNLDQEQRTKVQAVREKYKAQMKSLREQKRAAKEKMKSLKSSGSDSEITAAHKNLQTAKNQLADLRLQRMLEMKKILTTEQFDKLQSFRKERKMGRKERKEKGGY